MSRRTSGARRLGSRRGLRRLNRLIPLNSRRPVASQVQAWDGHFRCPYGAFFNARRAPVPLHTALLPPAGTPAWAEWLNNIVQEEISMRNAMIVAAAMALTPAVLSAQAAGGSMGALGAAQSGGPGTTPVEQTTGSVGTGTLDTMTPAATNLGSGATSRPAHHRRKSATTPSSLAASSSAGSPNSAPK